MHLENIVFVWKGEPLNKVKSYGYNQSIHQYNIIFDNGETRDYPYEDLECIYNPQTLDITMYKLSNYTGRQFYNVSKILLFSGKSHKFYKVFFKDVGFKYYREKDLIISKNLLSDENINGYFDYYKKTADIVGLKVEDEKMF